MSVCALVLERVNIREDGRVRQKLGRIIIGFEDDSSYGGINFISKYIHYPASDFVHSHFCWLYNGIDANTLSTQGEKYCSVIDWARAAIRSRKVIVNGSIDVQEVVGKTPCDLIDLQEFFYSVKTQLILEPISLARLVKKLFGRDFRNRNSRDPFEECTLKIGLYHVMCAYKICGKAPPFDEIMFPKVEKVVPVAPPITSLNNGGKKNTSSPHHTSSPSTRPVSPAMQSAPSKSPHSPDHTAREPKHPSRDEGMMRFQGEESLTHSLEENLKVSEPITMDDCNDHHAYENDSDEQDVLNIGALHDDPEYCYSSQIFKPSHFAAFGCHREQQEHGRASKAKRTQDDGPISLRRDGAEGAAVVRSVKEGKDGENKIAGAVKKLSGKFGYGIGSGVGRGMFKCDQCGEETNNFYCCTCGGENRSSSQSLIESSYDITNRKKLSTAMNLIKDESLSDEVRRTYLPPTVIVNVMSPKPPSSRWKISKRCRGVISCVVDFA